MTTVRFPPSPTGHLHLGSARTALFNYLFAKANNGKIVFRWEDTDKERSETKYETEILEGLKWLGMDFEKESTQIYRQTNNMDFHANQLEKLWESGKVFPCFTSKEELDALRQKAQKERTNFVFWSPFRDVSRSELKAKMDAGESFVWRLKVSKNQEITFEDLIRGTVVVNSNTIGDFVVARSDGSVLYLLANVLDDMQQEISHVIRGEDHISNTPKQILLCKSIDTSVPVFGHIPLVLDEKGKKLSKRNVQPDVCVLISDFQKAGFIPAGVINGLAFLGWNPKTTDEIFSLESLESVFDLKKVNPAAAKYDYEKMKWMRKIPTAKLIEYYNEYADANYKELTHSKAFNEAKEKAKTLDEFTTEFEYLIKDPGIDVTKLAHEKMQITSVLAKTMLFEVRTMLEKIEEKNFNRTFIREEAVKVIKRLGCKNGHFLWPFRVALSNSEKSSGPFEIAEVIEKNETISRITRAIENV